MWGCNLDETTILFLKNLVSVILTQKDFNQLVACNSYVEATFDKITKEFQPLRLIFCLCMTKLYCHLADISNLSFAVVSLK